jgi:hypothetical protein
VEGHAGLVRGFELHLVADGGSEDAGTIEDRDQNGQYGDQSSGMSP